MKERFVEFKKKAGERLEAILRVALDIPPSFEEVYLNFEHDSRCSKAQNLVPLELEHGFTVYDGSGLGMNHHLVSCKVKYLKCPECHSSSRYSG